MKNVASFSVEIYQLGGPSRREMKDLAKEVDVKIRFFHSFYKGHVGVEVQSEKRRPIRAFYKSMGWGTPWD